MKEAVPTDGSVLSKTDYTIGIVHHSDSNTHGQSTDFSTYGPDCKMSKVASVKNDVIPFIIIM
jgi:hypothetical protein